MKLPLIMKRDTAGKLSAEYSIRFTPPLGGERNGKRKTKNCLWADAKFWRGGSVSHGD